MGCKRVTGEKKWGVRDADDAGQKGGRDRERRDESQKGEGGRGCKADVCEVHDAWQPSVFPANRCSGGKGGNDGTM